MRALHTLFVAFSVASVPLLWAPMFLNGTIDDITYAKKHNILPDGSPLKTTYTGIALIDELFDTLVPFFYALGCGKVLGPKLMLIDLASTLHVALGWMVIESLRQGQKAWYLRIPGILGVIWNAAGAGIILPLFCLWHLATPVSDTRITSEHAKTLPLAVLVSSIPFWMMILPPAGRYSVDQHQTITAVFTISPLIWIAAQYAFSTLFSMFGTRGKQATSSGGNSSSNAKFYLMASHLLLALYSAVFHFYCIFTCLFSSDPSATISRVFIPNPWGVDPKSPQRMAQAAILFLQYDWLIIHLTNVLYAYLLLETPILAPTKGRDSEGVLMKLITCLPFGRPLSSVIVLALLTVVLGPSTSVSLALWQREKYLGTQIGTQGGEGRSTTKHR